MSGALVIGIGNPDRGDDGAGRLVARRLRELVPGLAPCELDGAASALLDRLSGRAAAYVIDAAATGRPIGAVQRFDAGHGPLPSGMDGCSTHGLGLAEAIELARALGTLPPRCIVYAIEGRDFSLGAPVSPAVAAAVEEVAARILRELRTHGA